MVSQLYDTDVNKAYVIRGNAAVLKCEIPSFVADFVSVVSWHTDQDETFYPVTDYGLWATHNQLFVYFNYAKKMPGFGFLFFCPTQLIPHFNLLHFHLILNFE